MQRQRPSNQDFPAHYQGYVTLVPDGDVLAILEEQLQNTMAFFQTTTEEQNHFRYAEGKWNLFEVVGHMIDTERVMAYRLLRIAREDQTPLAGYDDELYVKNGNFSNRTMDQLLDEYQSVRLATISLLKGLPQRAWKNIGYANNGAFTVEAIAYIIAGHERHHLKIVKERYIGA